MTAAPTTAETLARRQRQVHAGVAVGCAYVALLYAAGLFWVEVPPVAAGGRLAYALPWLMPAGIMVLLGVFRVGTRRFTDVRIFDGGQPAAASAADIDRRVLGNTVEQFVILAPALLSLAVLVPDAHLGIVPALGLNFVLARAAFWVGYHMAPQGRAFGFAATMLPSVCAYGWAGWLWLSGA